MPASHDSEEGGQIGPAGDDRSVNRSRNDTMGLNLQNSGETKKIEDLDLINNGHLNPRQRRIYLILLSACISMALIGLTLLLVWMFKFRGVTGLGLSDADQLSNLHTIMMYTFMISLNMYSILIYRTHFMLTKERLKWTHAILSGLNIVLSLLGVFAMLKSHWMKGIPNFYSLHSWIGSITNAFYLTQFITGFITFLKPGLAQHRKSKIMPWHRFAGSMILILASCAAITGMSELVIFQDKDGLYSKFSPITFIVNFAGISTIIMTTITIYLISAPQYRRPRQAEEEPLKR